MKVNIITCHTPQNYGAMLQAYGLQTYLESKGTEVEIINYAPKIYFEEQSLMYIGNDRAKSNPLLALSYLLYMLPKRLKRRKIFNSFRKKHLHITKERYESIERLYLDPPIADQYICGSDQIWNTKGTRGFNPLFYLGFVKDIKRRNSYAASMSADFPLSDRVIGDVISHINNIEKISVRESFIQEKLQQYVSKPIVHVLDPVYLLNEDQWLLLANESKPLKEKYILIYPMGDNSSTYANAEILSKATGLPVYCITASNKKHNTVTKYLMPTVQEFLQLFKRAQFVITDSFHGTSFSIIFRKTFWSCQVNNNNHRITSLLDSLGLKDRYIPSEKEIIVNTKPIDFEKLEALLEEKIKKSKEFIKTIISKS